MSGDILIPPIHLQSAAVLRTSQQAPQLLKANPISALPWPLPLLTSTETIDTWTAQENLFLSCLRTGDDGAAYRFLERLTKRFGEDNERITALWGLYREATAKNGEEVEQVLKNYEEVIAQHPTNLSIRKRQIALLRGMGRSADALSALLVLVDVSPTDPEVWAELADLYVSFKMFSQACHCMEEVLLITPFSWNVHARLGEILYMSVASSNASNDGNTAQTLAQSMRRYCRSIELCDCYLRGYYGLKLVTTRLLQIIGTTSKPPIAVTHPVAGDLAPPTVSSIQKLNELATAKLAEIVRRGSAGEAGWDGYDEAELIAARELLDRDRQKVVR